MNRKILAHSLPSQTMPSIPATTISIIGRGESGKTQLLRALRGEPYSEESPTTWGLAISETTVKNQHLQFIDYLGQDESLLTPSINRSFSQPGVILAAIPLKIPSLIDPNPTDVSQWLDNIVSNLLQTIKQRSNGNMKATVVLAFTQSDHISNTKIITAVEEIIPGLIKQYPFVEGAFIVSAKTGDQITRLKEHLFSLSS